MPRSSCEPCCNPSELARSVPMWRDQVVQILCSIFGTLEGSSTEALNATWAYSETPFGSITPAFSVVLVNADDLKYLRLKNATDQDIQISFNNTDVHLYLEAGETSAIDVAADKRIVNTDISAKYVVQPTSGSLFVTGFS